MEDTTLTQKEERIEIIKKHIKRVNNQIFSLSCEYRVYKKIENKEVVKNIEKSLIEQEKIKAGFEELLKKEESNGKEIKKES